MIYMWHTGINYYKLAVEKDRDSIFTTMWKPCFISTKKAIPRTIWFQQYYIFSYNIQRQSIIRFTLVYFTSVCEQALRIFALSQFEKT